MTWNKMCGWQATSLPLCKPWVLIITPRFLKWESIMLMQFLKNPWRKFPEKQTTKEILKILNASLKSNTKTSQLSRSLFYICSHNINTSALHSFNHVLRITLGFLISKQNKETNLNGADFALLIAPHHNILLQFDAQVQICFATQTFRFHLWDKGGLI